MRTMTALTLKMKSNKSHFIFAIAAIIAAVALFLRIAARSITGFADHFRALMIPVATNTLSRLWGVFPFSVVEIMILAILIGLAVLLLRLVISILRRRFDRSVCLRTLSLLLLLISLIFFLYEAGEDVYFFATPFSVQYGIGSGSYETEDLYRVCKALAERCNDTSPFVSRRLDGIMENDDALSKRAAKQMQALGQTYPLLSGYYPPPKALLFSILMSKTNMTGIYSAYTGEANYNRLMPPYNTGFTMCHELSHLHGILQENQANFVAYLACREAEDADLRYSGALLGWVYCGNELYRRDPALWKEVSATLKPEVNSDLADNSRYWKQFEGRAAKAAQKFNDAYLKQAGQASGVQSYNEVVDLIVSYEMKQ